MSQPVSGSSGSIYSSGSSTAPTSQPAPQGIGSGWSSIAPAVNPVTGNHTPTNPSDSSYVVFLATGGQ